MTTKMKGLLKGLRYISHIFENEEEEPEMMIGYPTDVKHVAHIGWDGPSVNTPSWMNEFKSPSSSSSAPLETRGDANQEGSSVHSQQDSSRTGSLIEGTSQNPPKSSRRHASAGSGVDPESSHKGKSRSSRRGTKGASSSARDHLSYSEPTSPTFGGVESPKRSNMPVPDVPKKSRRKKSKESSLGKSSNKSRHSQHQSSFSDSGSVSSLKDDVPPSRKPSEPDDT